MRRETQNVLLILLGIALLKLALTGQYLRYVKPAHLVWLVGGGAVILLLGSFAALRSKRRVPTAEHGHSHGTRSSWFLLAPVLTVALIAPPALGADSVYRSSERGSVVEARGSLVAEYDPLPKGDPVWIPVIEFALRAAYDELESLDGRVVKLVGFVVHRDGEALLARMVIGCCAADAAPVTVKLGGSRARDIASSLEEDAWISVTGTLVSGSATEATSFTPELTVDTIATIDAPSDPYEY